MRSEPLEGRGWGREGGSSTNLPRLVAGVVGFARALRWSFTAPTGTAGLGPTGTIGPIVAKTVEAVGSRSTPAGSDHAQTSQSGAALMIKDVVARSWRFAVTVAPIVAIALTLAAGLKWR
jgi:hypothetical protein